MEQTKTYGNRNGNGHHEEAIELSAKPWEPTPDEFERYQARERELAAKNYALLKSREDARWNDPESNTKFLNPITEPYIDYLDTLHHWWNMPRGAVSANTPRGVPSWYTYEVPKLDPDRKVRTVTPKAPKVPDPKVQDPKAPTQI